MKTSRSTKDIRRGLAAAAFCTALAACGGGGSGGAPGADPTPTACSGTCADTSSLLTVADVQTVIARGVAEAKARNVQATIAVVDRVGNVLGIYRMAGQDPTVHIATTVDENGDAVVRTGLEGIRLPLDAAAAVTKAITGAYLSSEGNAFTTRTANQIVQQNFNPGERNQPAGPLFGVQFSQMACSDFSRRFNGVGVDAGPKRSPLGLSADPGGLPLFKGGTAVGGVGVMADGLYTIDPVISDFDLDVDELIAVAASFGFGAPVDRRADRITADGKTLRFADVDEGDLTSNPQSAPGFATLTPADGALVSLPGYTTGAIVQGTAFGTAASGIRADGNVNYPDRDAFVFVDENDSLRFPPTDGTDAAITGTAALSAAEVRTIISEALGVANRARAQIRRPVGSQARVTISVVDTTGVVLGMARTRDAPVFGADVSLQKARTAALFSSPGADAYLNSLPDAFYVGPGTYSPIGGYVTALQNFLGNPDALVTGEFAFSDRAGGNLSRPFFPDGLTGSEAGPLSKPAGEWSVFSTGLQLDLSINGIVQHVAFLLGLASDVPQSCAGVGIGPNLTPIASTVAELRTANGIQIFPGSVPVYRGDTLVGGVGVSGDGVDQDDMIAFLGVHNAGEALGGAIGNAPPARRADNLTPHGVRLRFVQCPQAPFLDSDDTNVCEGK
ncbi:MAG: heme-binding protein [Pseudomonadales bacterium]